MISSLLEPSSILYISFYFSIHLLYFPNLDTPWPKHHHLLGLIEFLYTPNVNTWATSLRKTAIKFWSSLHYRFELSNSSNTLRAGIRAPDSGLPTTCHNSSFNGDGAPHDRICREDVEMVMGNLGLCWSEEAQERFAPEDITRQFEEEEPSLEEVKEAFCVFDVNRDGFIDADELRRVLCGLGFAEGKDVEDCKMMIIRSFDENGDGRIDFPEFVKLIENRR